MSVPNDNLARLRRDHDDLHREFEEQSKMIRDMSAKIDKLVALMSAGSMAARVLKWTATVGAALVAIAAFGREMWFHK